MSFSKQVKTEIARHEASARHCQIAEFSAIFQLIGKIKTGRNGKVSLQIHTENLTVAQKSYMLLWKIFRVQVDVVVSHHCAHRESVTYTLKVRGQKSVLSILKAIKMVDEMGGLWGASPKIPSRLVQNTCCKRAYLRGSFLVAGSVTNPEKSYHLEIALPAYDYALQMQRLIKSFGLEAKIVERKKYHVLYMKEGAQIVDFLNIIEAHIALMELENVRILKEVRNSVNRQVNCETANIQKTVNAAARQMEDIRYIQCNMGVSRLADGLREVAELRLEYPDSSLVELGSMLNPPLGKSGVNHRLRKISKIAEQLREEKQGISPYQKED